MRVLVAALIGGIVMFIWGAAAHMALGLGSVGIRQPAGEDVVLGLGQAEPGQLGVGRLGQQRVQAAGALGQLQLDAGDLGQLAAPGVEDAVDHVPHVTQGSLRTESFLYSF